MKLQSLIILALLVSSALLDISRATDKTSTATGNWSTSSLWNPAGVPGSSDNVTIASGHTVTVDVEASCANLTVDNGGTLTLGATLHVGGNMLNNGTFTANSQTVEFNGVGLQTIGGTADGGGYIARFWNITINNAAGVKVLDNILIDNNFVLSNGQFDVNAKGVRLNAVTLTRANGTIVKNGGYFDLQGTIDVVYTGPCTTGEEFLSSLGRITVNVGSGNSVVMASNSSAGYALTLTSGNLLTGAYTLTLGYSGSIGTLNHTDGSIVGNFRRWITNTTVSNVVFPVGTASKYRPAVLSFTSAPSAGGTITATFTASDPGTNGVDLQANPINDGGYNITKVATDGYWSLTSGDGLTGGVYTIDITADGFAGVSDYTKLRIVKRTNGSSNWTVGGSHGTGTGSNAIPVAHRTGLSGFSEFGIGANTSDNPLPIELTAIAYSVEGLRVSLEWGTITETMNWGFDVERRVCKTRDTWSKIGFVQGFGTSSSPHRYSFTDILIAAGRYEYRLKQLGADGGYKYSSSVEVEVGNATHDFSLAQNYPNPFNPSTAVEFTVPEDQRTMLEIYDLLGREVALLFDQIAVAGTVYKITFDAGRLAAGPYVARLESGKRSMSKKIMLLK